MAFGYVYCGWCCRCLCLCDWSWEAGNNKVLELGLNFLTADDLSAILAAKLWKALGFGIVTKMRITSMHVEERIPLGNPAYSLRSLAWLSWVIMSQDIPLNVYEGAGGIRSLVNRNSRKLAEQGESIILASGVPYTTIEIHGFCL